MLQNIHLGVTLLQLNLFIGVYQQVFFQKRFYYFFLLISLINNILCIY